MNRDECTSALLAAVAESGTTYAALAEATGRHPVWVAAALHGQATMDADEASATVRVLGLGPDVAAALQRCPTKGESWTVPADPLLYRFHEILQTFGSAMKAVIHEEFGDGIMSAVDFDIDVERLVDVHGDRVKIVFTGKFLPYKKF